MLVSGQINFCSFQSNVWVPRIEENREAGESPARSRHCEETKFPEPGDLPNILQPFNTRAQVFRQPRVDTNPAEACLLVVKQMRFSGFRVF